MSMRGFVHDRLKASHDHHMEALEEIESRFVMTVLSLV
jgi:NAD+ kinase